ncbi:MAG: hypothetical protein U9R19_09900, partial [Bacteroidota bacterium]|nr:hypothetical protein [Bacteroidota bacterium]
MVIINIWSGNLVEIFVYDGAVFFITDKIITPGLCDNLVYDRSGVLLLKKQHIISDSFGYDLAFKSLE